MTICRNVNVGFPKCKRRCKCQISVSFTQSSRTRLWKVINRRVRPWKLHSITTLFSDLAQCPNYRWAPEFSYEWKIFLFMVESDRHFYAIVAPCARGKMVSNTLPIPATRNSIIYGFWWGYFSGAILTFFTWTKLGIYMTLTSSWVEIFNQLRMGQV